MPKLLPARVSYQDFRKNPDKETLTALWCEFITAMAEDGVTKDAVMENMLVHPIAIVELCGFAPSELYAKLLDRREN